MSADIRKKLSKEASVQGNKEFQESRILHKMQVITHIYGVLCSEISDTEVTVHGNKEFYK